MKLIATTEIDNWKVLLFAAILNTFIHQQPVLAASRKVPVSTKSSSPAPSRGDGSNGSNSPINHSLEKGIPKSVLSEIRSLDHHLKCFPKLLCTIYQDDSITKQGFLNATELGVAYIKLLKAVYYQPQTTTTTTTMAPVKRKRPIIQIFQIPMGVIKSSTYLGRKQPHHHLLDDDLEDYPYYSRSPLSDNDQQFEEDEDYSIEYDDKPGRRDVDDDDREYLKEKLEMSQMMQDLINEDKEEYKSSSSNEEKESGSLATSLLSSFLPFVGSRSLSKRSIDSTRVSPPADSGRRKPSSSNSHDRRQQKQLNKPVNVSKDPLWNAVRVWKKLKKRSQCQEMYKTCPFEAWEIVRMLDLVEGQAKILSAYLKLTVDKVRSRNS